MLTLAAILSMLLGIYIAHRLFVKRLTPQKTSGSVWKYNTALAIAYTALGVAFRAGIMGALNYAVLRYPMPIGYGLTEGAILGYFLPVTTIFNATLALYTIPLGYFIAEVVKRNFRHTQNAA